MLDGENEEVLHGEPVESKGNQPFPHTYDLPVWDGQHLLRVFVFDVYVPCEFEQRVQIVSHP